jgi:hypothetical protein
MTLLGLTGCLEDKKGKEELEQIRQQNQSLTRQLQQAQVERANTEAQLKSMRAELDKIKAGGAPAAPARTAGGTPAPAATPTGPAPANLPYSLYTGILLTTKGEEITLTSVNFGRIDRVPLVVNSGNVEVAMSKVKYMRRSGQADAAKTFPVTVQLVNGDEVRGRLQAEKVFGVDPRFGSKVEIPFNTVSEITFK